MFYQLVTRDIGNETAVKNAVEQQLPKTIPNSVDRGGRSLGRTEPPLSRWWFMSSTPRFYQVDDAVCRRSSKGGRGDETMPWVAVR